MAESLSYDREDDLERACERLGSLSPIAEVDVRVFSLRGQKRCIGCFE